MSGLTLSGGGGGTAGGAVELTDNSGARALKLHTDTPHLVSIGSDRLSTSVTLHPIPQGRITLGSGPGVDIPVQGTGVLPLHCHIENSEGIVTIYPLSENLSIDGVRVNGPTRLSQGVMLTIGRSNYMRFNHPAEAKLMKSVLPNPRISMAAINIEAEPSFQTKFNKKPPVAPRKSPRDSLSDSSSEEPPSSIMTKVSKFEYLAAQNYKKSISPKVFPANVVTVNMPMKDVIGRAPPDLNSFAKNLPQSALNYSELNHNEKQQVKMPGQQLLAKKPHQTQYVNVTLNETKNINNRVIIFENGSATSKANVNFDHNDLNNKTSSLNKNINISRVNTPSPSFNRNTSNIARSVTPSPVSNNVKADHRRSGSLGELTSSSSSYGDGYDDLTQRKYEAEIMRNKAQQDRIKEQEIEKAEQQRLEEILNMCAEYERQAQNEKSKPITPNRIKTNGSLPRDKRGQFAPPSPSYSCTPPASPLDILHNELLKQNNHYNYENVQPHQTSQQTNHYYENVELKSLHPDPHINCELRVPERGGSYQPGSPYENMQLPQSPGPYPPSPRTRIKTFVTPTSKDNNIKDAQGILDNKYAILEAEQKLLREAEQVLRQNLHNSKEFPSDSNIFESPQSKSTPNKFIFPLADPSEFPRKMPTSIDHSRLNFDTISLRNNSHLMRNDTNSLPRNSNSLPRSANNSLTRNSNSLPRSANSSRSYSNSSPNHSSGSPKPSNSWQNHSSGNFQDHNTNSLPNYSNGSQNHSYNFQDHSDSLQNHSNSMQNNSSSDSSNLHNGYREFRKSYGELNEDEKRRVEHLKKEKKDILCVISKLKRQMGDIEIQEEELHREIELEKALISGEYKAKLLDVEKIETRKQKLQKRYQRIEESIRDCQLKKEEDQNDCRRKLKLAQENMTRVEEKLASTEKTSPEYEPVFEEYLQAQELLDNEKKAFEDVEFHHLEEEADWLASREELQREISDLTKRIENLKLQIADLEQQKLETSRANNTEFRTIEKHKMECLMRLEEIRNRLKSIDNDLLMFSNEESEQEVSSDTDSDKSKDIDKRLSNMSLNKLTDMSCSVIISNSKIPAENMYNMSQSYNEKMFQEKSILEVGVEKKFPSQDDIDRISKVTSNAPIHFDESEKSLGRKTIESLKEIERNRHLHLCQQGSQVIEQERLRVQALKQKVQQEVKSKWAQRMQDCNSLNSSGSEDVRSSGVDDDQKRDSKQTSEEPDSKEASRDESENAESPRPLSETSEMSLEVGTLNRKRKPISDKQRPLTRYLPIRGNDLDLRQHIESAGHQVVLCPHVIINSSTCRGFLHKKGSKLNGWSKRWFVFDRNKHTFTYYSDKSEKKTRGGAYFQAIEEVYLDHLNSIKSPNPQLTFIVKTHERHYYLMAPSPEAMRIWVDVIFTGAEGYREFEIGT